MGLCGSALASGSFLGCSCMKMPAGTNTRKIISKCGHHHVFCCVYACSARHLCHRTHHHELPVNTKRNEMIKMASNCEQHRPRLTNNCIALSHILVFVFHVDCAIMCRCAANRATSIGIATVCGCGTLVRWHHRIPSPSAHHIVRSRSGENKVINYTSSAVK